MAECSENTPEVTLRKCYFETMKNSDVFFYLDENASLRVCELPFTIGDGFRNGTRVIWTIYKKKWSKEVPNLRTKW